jgi:AraC-like DNA-binding protein
MEARASQYHLSRFSTQQLPISEREPYWREFFGHHICHVEIELQPDCTLEADATMLAMPNVSAGWCHSLSPACWKRTSQHVKDGSDAFALIIPVKGAMMRSQLGHDLDVRTGEAVGILHYEPATLKFQRLDHIAVMIPGVALASSVASVEEASTRLVPRGSEAVRLLTAYIVTLFASPPFSEPAVGTLITAHICDLVALAVGATRDGKQVALQRGVRAARLKAIKADLERNLSLTLSAAAARQQVTPRYVQMLFEEDGTTFSHFALNLRLDRVYRWLTDPSSAAWTIGAIALEAGFGDLSHFNRSFRRRYGASPSEVRAEARRSQG